VIKDVFDLYGKVVGIGLEEYYRDIETRLELSRFAKTQNKPKDWRKRKDGSQDPAFFLNQPRFQGATILLTRDNFGCGSSREHAPWALLDQGFRCVIASSFADIFYNNCFQNGILPVVLKAEEVLAMMKDVLATPGYQLTVDLGNQTVTTPDGTSSRFEIDPFRKDCLYRGLDAIGLTLQHEATITSYEARRKSEAPWLFVDLRA
ncbi:MAG: 3-isopropylmalate dehydratase small subunit, partial [Nitrospirota bacterium]|nr:3-isopropylmalate dehydratase small subunit [Nitrospirota bacterium]